LRQTPSLVAQSGGHNGRQPAIERNFPLRSKPRNRGRCVVFICFISQSAHNADTIANNRKVLAREGHQRDELLASLPPVLELKRWGRRVCQASTLFSARFSSEIYRCCIIRSHRSAEICFSRSKISQKIAPIALHGRLFFGEPERREDIDTKSSHNRTAAAQIAYPISRNEVKCFAQIFRAVVFHKEKKWAEGVHFERLLKFHVMRGEYESQRGRLVGGAWQISVRPGREIEKLIDDFRPALLFVELVRSRNRAVPLILKQ